MEIQKGIAVVMIRIHPLFDAFYYSFYIEGLCEIFGTKSLRYDTRGDWPLVPHSLCFEMDGKRIYISAEDSSTFNSDGLQWADVYAKVNIDPNVVPEHHQEKVLPIGPKFRGQKLRIDQNSDSHGANDCHGHKFIRQLTQTFW